MSKAWIALSLAPAVVLIGCSTEPEPVAQVPPPNYAAEPEPLPPVSINQGNTLDTGPGAYEQPGSFEPEPLAPAQPVARTYIVRKGDTLWAIARSEYGNGQRWVDIAQANPSVDPKKLAVGQELMLP